MKELNYKDWLKNPVPRNMWVWDSSESNKKQRKVIYFLDPKLSYPIVALSDDMRSTEYFKYCAEIENKRRMTHKELSRWLRKKPTREWRWTFDNCICSVYDYDEQCSDKEVNKNIRIREDDGKWKEPLVDITVSGKSH